MKYTEKQIRNMSYDEKRNLAESTSTPEVLKELAKDDNYGIRIAVTDNIYTPVEILEAFSTDINWGLRAGAALHTNTPIEILRELATDEDSYVRFEVAENPNSTDQILVSVFEYERRQNEIDSDVLKAIISNANCPGYLKAVIQTMLEGME
jgi:hypothetical protein